MSNNKHISKSLTSIKNNEVTAPGKINSNTIMTNNINSNNSNKPKKATAIRQVIEDANKMNINNSSNKIIYICNSSSNNDR